MLRLDSDVQYVKGVGPRRASLLASRGIRTVEDLLLHIPKSYQDRANFVPLSSLRIGQDAAIHARVYRSRIIQTRTRGQILDVILTDGSSFAHAKWFHGGISSNPRFQRRPRSRSLTAAWISTATSRNSSSSILSLSFSKRPKAQVRWISAASFPSTKRLPESPAASSADRCRPHWLDLTKDVDDPLPDRHSQGARLSRDSNSPGAYSFSAAEDDLAKLNSTTSPYHRRLIFEEFFLLELIFALRRVQRAHSRAYDSKPTDPIRQRVKSILPFHPTAAQKRVLKEIVDDLKAPYPMIRLMQGDVGSGKTIVAFEAIVIAVENGYQAALMAPTEILAEQHFINAQTHSRRR